MARVTVELPSLLADATRGARTVVLEADRLDALERLVDRHPALEVHLFDEDGALREHVHCFLNSINTRWMPDLEVVLAEGDRIVVLQAVAGG